MDKQSTYTDGVEFSKIYSTSDSAYYYVGGGAPGYVNMSEEEGSITEAVWFIAEKIFPKGGTLKDFCDYLKIHQPVQTR